jgi:phosphoglycerate kinase
MSLSDSQQQQVVKTIADFNCANKKVIVRVDFNVPLDENFNVTDDTRIREALPTIRRIIQDGGAVILLSHLGRPKQGPDHRYSLRHVIPVVSRHLGQPVLFANDCVGPEVQSKANALQPGEILLCENVRFHPEEGAGDVGFAKELASLGEVYVNDAFGTAHRAQASTAIIARYFAPEYRMIGLLMLKEIENADKVLRTAKRPLTLVVGGAKVSDKIMIIRHWLPLADNIIIGGGMAFTFIKAQGGHVGNSLFEPDRLSEATEVLTKLKSSKTEIHLPVDVVAADKFDATSNKQITPAHQIPDGWMGLDIGPKTIAQFSEIILKSQTIVWNGPMGVFEMEAFRPGSASVANAIGSATSKGAYSLVGGGDSVAVLRLLNLMDRMSFVSTGGGAMLEMLEGKELPGIAAVSN